MTGEPKDVETDLDTLKENWTPKQIENWEEHGEPKFERLDELQERVDEGEGELEPELAKKWYLRSYRPKKRGDGMMERDHVKVGQPERYFIKFTEKLNGPRVSIHSLMMEGPWLDSELKEEIEDAATALVASDALESPMAAKRLFAKLDEHQHILELYGFDVDGVEAE